MDDPFAGVPVRLCVDRWLADHLLAPAGKLAARERPDRAVLLAPTADLPDDSSGAIVRDAVFTDEDRAHLIFARVGLLRKAKWDIGRTITIGFYPDAPAGVPSRIMTILEESSEVMNLRWRQVPVDRAEYRVGFQRGNGLWSLIGSQCLMMTSGPTCNLGDVNWSDPRDLVRCARHEIVGHGSGALHAQQLPSYAQLVDLDEPAIINYYMQSQGWSYEEAQAQFAKVAAADIEEGLATATSIMAYEVNPHFDRRGVGIPFNWDWDDADRAQFARSYPQAGPVLPPVPDQDPPSGVPALPWGKVVVLPYRGGVVRARLTATGPLAFALRIQEAAAGTPVLDLISRGNPPVRVPPAVRPRGDVTRFEAQLAAGGTYEAQIGFNGPAPTEIRVVASKLKG
jgi:serralysin